MSHLEYFIRCLHEKQWNSRFQYGPKYSGISSKYLRMLVEKEPFKRDLVLQVYILTEHTHTRTNFVMSSRVQMFPAARGHWSPPFTVNKALLQQWQLTYCNASGDGDESGWNWMEVIALTVHWSSGGLGMFEGQGLKKKRGHQVVVMLSRAPLKGTFAAFLKYGGRDSLAQSIL